MKEGWFGDTDLDFLGNYCIMHWEWLAAMSWLNWAWDSRAKEFGCRGPDQPGWMDMARYISVLLGLQGGGFWHLVLAR